MPIALRAQSLAEVDRIVGHTPLDRPASGRVLEKAGYVCLGEEQDEHEGVPLRVKRWELRLSTDRLARKTR